MTITLSEPSHIAAYDKIRAAFSDVAFLLEIDEQLKEAIIDCDKEELSKATVKFFAHRYFDVTKFVTKADKVKFAMIQLIFQTLCVHIESQRPELLPYNVSSFQELKKIYPDLEVAQDDDPKRLLEFCNMMRACIRVIEPKYNKQTCIDICGRFEGTKRRYITGKKPRIAVRSRVAIYEHEGNVIPEKRPDRNRGPSNKRKIDQESSEASESPPKKRTLSLRKEAELKQNGARSSAQNAAAAPAVVGGGAGAEGGADAGALLSLLPWWSHQPFDYYAPNDFAEGNQEYHTDKDSDTPGTSSEEENIFDDPAPMDTDPEGGRALFENETDMESLLNEDFMGDLDEFDILH